MIDTSAYFLVYSWLLWPHWRLWLNHLIIRKSVILDHLFVVSISSNICKHLMLLTSHAAIFLLPLSSLPLAWFPLVTLSFTCNLYLVVWGMAWDDASHRAVSVNVVVGSLGLCLCCIVPSNFTLQNFIYIGIPFSRYVMNSWIRFI